LLSELEQATAMVYYTRDWNEVPNLNGGSGWVLSAMREIGVPFDLLYEVMWLFFVKFGLCLISLIWRLLILIYDGITRHMLTWCVATLLVRGWNFSCCQASPHWYHCGLNSWKLVASQLSLKYSELMFEAVTIGSLPCLTMCGHKCWAWTQQVVAL